MKKVTTAIIVLAAFILMPFYPVAQAAVTGTFSATVTVPNVSATTIVFPALSGGADASASTTISIPDLSGGVDGTAAVAATGTITVTGTTGSTTSITVGSTQLFAASTSIAAASTTAQTAMNVATAINANTSTSGFSATTSGSTIIISAPTSMGASANNQTIVASSDYLGGATAFGGGVTGTAGASATTTTSAFASTTANVGADLALDIGSTTITLTGGQTAAQVAASVAAQINTASSSPYTASVANGDQVMLTAKVSGAAGNGPVVASDLSYNFAVALPAASISGHFAAVVTGTTSDRTLNIGGVSITLTPGDSGAQAAIDVATQINASSSSPYTAAATNTDEVMLTATTTGSSGNGTVVASDLSYNATPEVEVFTPGNVTADETYRVTINSTNYDVTANASSTAGSIVAALTPMINANTAVTCSQDGASITCTAKNAGTPFTGTATVLASTGPSLSPVTIGSNNANSSSCAKAGDVVTLTFTTSHPIATSTSSVLINGATTTITWIGNNQYSATYTTNASTTPGAVTFLISGTDTNSNTATTSSTTDSSSVTFINVAPTITLNGNSSIELANGATYNEQGATATDALGRSITVSTSGNINTAIAGPQTVTYTATDCAGNRSTATRTINVDVAPASSGGSQSGSTSYSTSYGSTTGTNAGASATLLTPITTGPGQVLGAYTSPEIQAQIVVVKQELISLITQLIAALQAQIVTMGGH